MAVRYWSAFGHVHRVIGSAAKASTMVAIAALSSSGFKILTVGALTLTSPADVGVDVMSRTAMAKLRPRYDQRRAFAFTLRTAPAMEARMSASSRSLSREKWVTTFLGQSE